MFATQLLHGQLALLEARGQIAQLQAGTRLHVGVVGYPDRGFVFGVAQEQVQRLDGMIFIPFDAGGQRGGQIDLIHGALGVGDHDVLGLRRRAALGAVLVAGFGTVIHQTQHAEPPGVAIAEIPSVAARTGELQVRRDRFIAQIDIAVQIGRNLAVDQIGLLDRMRIAVLIQGLENVGRAEVSLETCQLRGQFGGKRAAAIVSAEIVAAGIAQAAAGAVRMDPRADLELQERRLGYAAGAYVNAAAAEGGRQVGRKTLGHGQRIQNGSRKQIQRNDVAGQIRRRHIGTVQRGAGVALAQSAHVNELALYQRHAGQAAQRGGHRAVTHSADLIYTQEVGNHFLLDALLHHVGGHRTLAAGGHHLFDGLARGCG